MSHAASQNVIVTRGTMADLPPPPSLFHLLESAREDLNRRRQEEQEAKALAYQRAQQATDWAVKRASAHVPAMLDFLRSRSGRWASTAEIRDAINRQAGTQLDCGNIAKVLRDAGVQERQKHERCMWRVE